MTYGHAERALAAIRRLEAETRELLAGLPHLDPEQSQWLQEVTIGNQRHREPAAVTQPAGDVGPAAG